MNKFEMGGYESPQPKKSEEAQVPSGGDINIPIPNYNIAASQFITLPDGSLMTKEVADRYYGTLGRPLEQREIMPRKVGVADQPFSANEALVMAAATANMIATNVELEIKTGKSKESAYELVNPVIEKRGIKVMKKLMDKLGSGATPEQVCAASVKYVEDLEKMFAEERIDPANRRYFEGELLAAKSAKRRLSDVVYQIESSGKYRRSLSEDYDLLISQHNDYLKEASAASTELEQIKKQTKILTQTQTTDITSPEVAVPKRELPMTQDEIEEAKKLVLNLNRRKENLTTLVPDDDIERMKFAKSYFGEPFGDEANTLPVTEENIQILKEYFIKELQKNGRMAKAAKGRISSHLSGIFGSRLGASMTQGGIKRFAFDVVRTNTYGKEVDPEAFNKMSARQFAEQYLGINIYDEIPDYDSLFV